MNDAQPVNDAHRNEIATNLMRFSAMHMCRGPNNSNAIKGSDLFFPSYRRVVYSKLQSGVVLR